MKGFLARHPELVGWLGGIGIPLALAVAVTASTFIVTKSIEGAKLDSEYIRIALGILSKDGTKTSDDDPTGYSDEEMALRQWAVRLLNGKSPEKFSLDEQHALLKVGTFYNKDGGVLTRHPDGSSDYTSSPLSWDTEWSEWSYTKPLTKSSRQKNPKSPSSDKDSVTPSNKKQ